MAKTEISLTPVATRPQLPLFQDVPHAAARFCHGPGLLDFQFFERDIRLTEAIAHRVGERQRVEQMLQLKVLKHTKSNC